MRSGLIELSQKAVAGRVPSAVSQPKRQDSFLSNAPIEVPAAPRLRPQVVPADGPPALSLSSDFNSIPNFHDISPPRFDQQVLNDPDDSFFLGLFDDRQDDKASLRPAYD